jgi:hypothetical protein
MGKLPGYRRPSKYYFLGVTQGKQKERPDCFSKQGFSMDAATSTGQSNFSTVQIVAGKKVF